METGAGFWVEMKKDGLKTQREIRNFALLNYLRNGNSFLVELHVKTIIPYPLGQMNGDGKLWHAVWHE